MGLPYWTTPSSPPKPASSPVSSPASSSISTASPSATTPRSPIRSAGALSNPAVRESIIRTLAAAGTERRETRFLPREYVSSAADLPASTDALIAVTDRIEETIRDMQEDIARIVPETVESLRARISRGHTLTTSTGDSVTANSGRDSGPMMESLGRFVASSQAQRNAAMEAGRRAHRDRMGIENPARDHEDEDTPEAAAVRDPLTWRTRDDGSVIPPSMETSQYREQPEPFLSDNMDFNARAAQLERTRTEVELLESTHEMRVANLRAEASRNTLRAPRERMPGLTQQQSGAVQNFRERWSELERLEERLHRERSERQATLVESRSEVDRLQRERSQRDARRPNIRGISNLRRHMRHPYQSPFAAANAEIRRRLAEVADAVVPVGGLGDRERSLSPENDSGWDTLLTTIPPDPQPPSASSSFTSAVTSAAASAGSSSFGARSQDSSVATSVNVGDVNVDLVPDMDVDEDDEDGPNSDSNDESFENICETFESRGSDNEDEGNSASNSEVRTLAQAQSIATDVFWRGYTDVVTRRADRVARVASLGGEAPGALGAGHPFGGMQRIVQRLAMREDIPDEWWATAGLARIVAREED